MRISYCAAICGAELCIQGHNNSMYLRNALIYGADCRFHRGGLEITGSVISKVFTDQDTAPCRDGDLDAKDSYVIPGLIDLHFHGALGYDVCDATEEAFEKITAFELSRGVTSVCPATMTLPADTLCEVLAAGKRFADKNAGNNRVSELVGFNMEGPFISPAKKGAQNEAFILKATVKTARRFIEASGGLVKILGLAPEESPDFESYICRLKDQVMISLAHTNADYDTAMRAIKAGACHAVHLYNAMSPFSHRDPGTVNAVFDSNTVTAELIGDGIHLHPAAVRTAFRQLSRDRIVLISDSLRAAGMPDGLYELGGQRVKKEGRLCTLAEGGTIAGSVSSLFDCMTNLIRTADIPLEEAVQCASVNPARILGLSQRLGELSPGKQADLVILNKELELEKVFKRGEIVL